METIKIKYIYDEMIKLEKSKKAAGLIYEVRKM